MTLLTSNETARLQFKKNTQLRWGNDIERTIYRSKRTIMDRL